MPTTPYDALLIMSFGGPEGLDDVMPFLDNVLRGKNVPDERKREVAHHYELFGGVSPINLQNRQLQAALETELERRGIDLPIYMGNRNWTPFVADAARAMQAAGVKRFLTLVTSGFSCYSGCRQYREDIARALASLGPDAPASDKIRVWYNHPLFIDVWARHWKQAFARLPESARANAATFFTAHSIPSAMAAGCAYEAQLQEACRLTTEAAGIRNGQLVYQSRSGPPAQPWLEPDILDAIRAAHAAGATGIVLAPIGFISDHMEVLYDLDREAKELAQELGLPLVRAATPGTHPLFVQMLGELVQERIDPATPKRAIGARPPNHDVCPENCCPSGRPTAPRG
ncbi:MAG TPA: ferrochelatase [Kiritimatiellia bacterium]|nr:ferrochelatase [Kiritimatiellia bacterium]